MHCAIWYHLYNLKNVKNTHGGVLILVTKIFSRFLNCTDGTKSLNASHLAIIGAIRDTSRENIYQDLNLESLQSRLWYRKLAMFYKIHNNKSLFNRFKVIPEKASYAMGNVHGIPLIKIKHNFF